MGVDLCKAGQAAKVNPQRALPIGRTRCDWLDQKDLLSVNSLGGNQKRRRSMRRSRVRHLHVRMRFCIALVRRCCRRSTSVRRIHLGRGRSCRRAPGRCRDLTASDSVRLRPCAALVGPLSGRRRCRQLRYEQQRGHNVHNLHGLVPWVWISFQRFGG
jgi:hypothetical protein